MSAVVSTYPTPVPSRPDTPERWQRASERAKLANVQVTQIDDLGTYRVTSASHPGVSYESDGIHCTCKAAEVNDPICLHRAAVRDHHATEKPCSVCGGTGWEHFSIWDWRNGCAVDLYSMPCRCTQPPTPVTPAPVAPAQPVRTGLVVLHHDLAAAKAALAKIDDELVPFNASLEFEDGSYAHRNRRQHDRLLRLREIAQQKVWDAQDALDRAQKVQVAA